MNPVYLVLEFDTRIIYLPFKDLEIVDCFTVMYDNPLELVASFNQLLELNIPNTEILDAYLSESIDKINDDMQEFDKRYLAIKYRNDNFDKESIKIVLANYLKESIKRIDEYNGFSQVLNNYCRKKDGKYTNLTDKDIEYVAKRYLGNNYKRYKECFFKLKDKKRNIKINEIKIDYTKIKELEEAEKMTLIVGTDMSIDELKAYTESQYEIGKKR